MPTAELKAAADAADVIINGYAFLREDGDYRVLNLNRPNHAAVFSNSGEMIETNMDDIELTIAVEYLGRARDFMEPADA